MIFLEFVSELKLDVKEDCTEAVFPIARDLSFSLGICAISGFLGFSIFCFCFGLIRTFASSSFSSFFSSISLGPGVNILLFFEWRLSIDLSAKLSSNYSYQVD
jgi:hypothetical protein